MILPDHEQGKSYPFSGRSDHRDSCWFDPCFPMSRTQRSCGPPRGVFRSLWKSAPMGEHGKTARRSVSRVLSARVATNGMAIPLGRPSPCASRDQPGRRAGTPVAAADGASPRQPGHPSLFGLAPGGVYHAAPVAGGAVRSYRTLSPLPSGPARRSALCGTFPGVTPAGRYPAPCSRGARTFLPRRKAGSDHPTVWLPDRVRVTRRLHKPAGHRT